ncbi:MAG TPA: hypothetical protein VEU77_01780 [Candidatus Acidoferrales bacterium]|nr:hypothetical protein [Candidatus Acidoferrales bacterium]
MLRSDVRSAFQYGLAIFTLTALLGLANATQLFGPLSHDQLITHLHSGTLGWITMGVIGLTVWMFSGRDLNMQIRLSALATVAYVAAFWSGNFQARAIFGAIELVVIYAWWWFVLSRVMSEGFGHADIPKLCVLFGLTTLAIGSTLGATIQIILGTGGSLPTSADLIGAHASAQTGGYLVLVAAGVIEWQLTGGGSRSRAGMVQIALLFIGGLLVAISLLLGIQQLAGPATLLTLIGILIVISRLGRAAMGVSWTMGGKRHLALGVPFVLLAVILEVLLVQQFIAANGNPDKVSVGLLHSLDHSFFVGLMTNVLFGSILVFSKDQPRVWPWADNVIFWGLNIGVVSFIVVLLTVGSGEGAQPFTSPVAFTAPIMGLSALLGIVTLLMRLQGAPATMGARAPARS